MPDRSMDPVWLSYWYYLEVNKGKLLGQGSFKNCCQSVGLRFEDGPLEIMVAKCLKYREAKKGFNKLPKYDEMGSLYTGFNQILNHFKTTCLGIQEVLLMSHWRRRLENLRV